MNILQQCRNSIRHEHITTMQEFNKTMQEFNKRQTYYNNRVFNKTDKHKEKFLTYVNITNANRAFL